MYQLQKTVIISGGGTGGHIFPGLSVADRLESRGVNVIYIGSRTGLETEIVRGVKTYFLPVVGWVGKSIPGRLEFIFKLIPSVLISLGVLTRWKANAILITGGFVSVPVGIAAYLLRKPLFTLVLDSHPGMAVKLFSNISREVFLPYEGVFNGLGGRKVVTGIPLRKTIISDDKEMAYRYFSLDPEKKTLLVVGGSRGAESLVKLSLKLTARLDDKWQFLIQTGKHKFKSESSRVRILPFIERMDYAYSISDMIISRSGAVLTAEIEETGLPVIFIPYPYAYLDHQYHNAERLKDRRSNVMVIREKEMSIDRIISGIKYLEGKKEYSETVDSANKIAERMYSYVWKN